MTSNSTTPPTPIAASPNRRPFTSADGGRAKPAAMIGPGKMRDVRTALAANRAPPDVAKKLGNYPELGREAARRIPNAGLIEFPQLGHAPQIQAPDEFHAALLRALER